MTTQISGKFDFGFFVNLELQGLKNVLEWCLNMKVISGHYECPVCKSQMTLTQKPEYIDGFVWVCHQVGENGEHFIERSVRQGSFLQRSPDMSIIQIFLLVYLWIKKASNEFIEDELELPRETIDDWLTFLREVCVEIILRKNSTLGGKDVIVEISECKFQEKNFKLSDYDGGWAYIGLEKESDKGFLEIVREKSESELAKAIGKYILPGSMLVSECWKLYDCLGTEEFKDLKKNSNIKFIDTRVGVIGSKVVGLHRAARRTLELEDCPYYNRDFDLYASEYMWRRLNSDYPFELIRSFLDEIVILFPPMSKDPDLEEMDCMEQELLEENKIVIKTEIED